MSDTETTAAVPGETEIHPPEQTDAAGAAPDASDGSGAAASGDEPTDREAAVQRLGVATDAALNEMGYERATTEPLTEVEAQIAPPPPPTLGILIHDMGDGNAGIHAIEPDGTEHAISMPMAHGALIAFMDMIRGRLPELGNRATAYTVKKPGDDDEPAEPPAAA
jgi:hypothetical protein